MTNAFKNLEMLVNPTDPKYDVNKQLYQACPSIAISKGGRMFAAWCTGGNTEPHIENHNVIVYSDDLGKTWSAPILVFPSSAVSLTQVLDMQLWVSPEGKLMIFLARDDVLPNTGFDVDGHIFTPNYVFLRNKIANWLIVCNDPDADDLKFEPPVCWGTGIMRTNPLVMSNGEWLICNNDPYQEHYSYSISPDKGKTFERRYGPVKQEVVWAEPMAYEKSNGDICLFARCKRGEIAEATSHDMGKTWTESSLTDITAPDSRMFVSRTPSGRLLLVHNNHPKVRTNITVALSEDDGASWKYSRLVDARKDISYPDVDFYNGRIYLIYERERFGKDSAREILLAGFTEEDIMNENYIFESTIISKSTVKIDEYNPGYSRMRLSDVAGDVWE